MNYILSEFEVRWGNQNKLPFTGWVDLKVSFASSTNPDVIVPLPVTPDTLDPIPFTVSLHNQRYTYEPMPLHC